MSEEAEEGKAEEEKEEEAEEEEDEIEKTYDCIECAETFDEIAHLYTHMETVHTEHLQLQLTIDDDE